jgi:Superinfection immunity protein
VLLGAGAIHNAAFLIFLGLYFLPTVVAFSRRVVNRGSVAVINVFLGWTFIGWVVALAMALRTRTIPRV